MNRRKFLAMIAAGGVVTASGMWMPGSKLISIPKKGNRILTVDEVTRQMLTTLSVKMNYNGIYVLR